MSLYANVEALTADVNRLLMDKFGTNELPRDLDDVLHNMLIYHDVHQILTTPHLQHNIEEIVSDSESTDQLAEKLSILNTQVEGLRIAYYAVTSSDSLDQTIASLARTVFLDDKSHTQLQAIITTYASVLQQVHDLSKVSIVDDEDSLLRCLSDSLVNSYVNELYQSRDWLRPEEALFPVEMLRKLIDDQDLSMIMPNGFTQLLLNEDHYNQAVIRFERLKQPFLADVARLFLLYGQMTRDFLDKGEFEQPLVIELQQQLDHIDKYDPVEMNVFGDLNDFFLTIQGSIRYMVAMQPILPLQQRVKQLEKAEQMFDTVELLQIRVMSPMIRWNRSKLFDGFEREKLELSAFNRVNELLSISILEKEPLQRASAMSLLMMLPAQWKLDKGDFQGAIESASMAKSLSLSVMNLMTDEIAPIQEEVTKYLADPEAPKGEMDQIVRFQDTIATMLESGRMMEFMCDLLILTSRAKLAETHGDFVEAYELYQVAAKKEKEMLDKLRSLLMIYFDTITTSQRLLQQGFQHEARATYFQAVALLNRGDKSLMEADYSAANQSYKDAQSNFVTAAELWSREVDRLLPSQQDVTAIARQENILNTLRARYCDAKIEMALAEQYSGLGESWEAAKRFERAAGVFRELLANALLKETSRNIEIFKASSDYCKGRAILEMDRDARRQDNLAEGRQLLDKAALRFEQAGEGRWARYIQALRLEYEAMIAIALAQNSALPNSLAYSQLAQSKAYDAASIFRQVGAAQHARTLENMVRVSTQTDPILIATIVLPKPVDALPSLQSPVQRLANPYDSLAQGTPDKEAKMEAQLRRLEARAISLRTSLDDLKDRRDRGRIDDGRYMDLRSDLDQERIELLFTIRATLQGRDQDVDEVIQGAINGEKDEILMDQLAQVAEKKGFGRNIVEQLNNHKGFIVSWLVEIGIQLAKRGGVS